MVTGISIVLGYGWAETQSKAELDCTDSTAQEPAAFKVERVYKQQAGKDTRRETCGIVPQLSKETEIQEPVRSKIQPSKAVNSLNAQILKEETGTSEKIVVSEPIDTLRKISPQILAEEVEGQEKVEK